MSLEMRPDCERCGADLPAEAPGAFICSFECTFCAECAAALDDVCPNCSGELLDRPNDLARDDIGGGAEHGDGGERQQDHDLERGPCGRQRVRRCMAAR